MSVSIVPTGRRGPRRRKRRALRRFLILFLVILLAALGFYYATQYVRDLDYARHPLKYRELIVDAAAEFGLDPAHIAAVILSESSFRSEAVSSAGALGLMQIMPDTGAWIAGKFADIETFAVDTLVEPQLNIRFGSWYLMWLLDRYDGDMLNATAAYHAGQGRVDQWLQNAEYSADGVTLRQIPYRETSRYTERVLRAYEKYRELYDFAS